MDENGVLQLKSFLQGWMHETSDSPRVPSNIGRLGEEVFLARKVFFPSALFLLHSCTLPCLLLGGSYKYAAYQMPQHRASDGSRSAVSNG